MMAQNHKAAETSRQLDRARAILYTKKQLLLAEIAHLENDVRDAETAHRVALDTLSNWK